MRTLWIPVLCAGVIIVGVGWFVLGGGEPVVHDRDGGRGGSAGDPGDATARSEAAESLRTWDPTREPPPRNELLEPPPEVATPDQSDATVSLTALPGASWGEITTWFRDSADLDARLAASEEILAALPREDALDRLLLLAAALPLDGGAVEFGLALGNRLADRARESATELERFRRILTRGGSPGERSVALPPVVIGTRYEGFRVGVVEAFELAYYKVPDPAFSAVLLDAIDALDLPGRAARWVGTEFDRAALAPGSGHFEAAITGTRRTLRVLERAENDLAAGVIPVGSPLRTEVRMARETGLRQTLIDRVFTVGADGRRTAPEVEAAIEFLTEHARGRVSRFRETLAQNAGARASGMETSTPP